AELFADETLADIASIRNELASLPNIASVTTILDVPLVSSPAVDLRNMAAGIRYLRDANTDRALAGRELSTSPLYRNLLISDDAGTTAMHVALKNDVEQLALREQRDSLRESQVVRGLTSAENEMLVDVSARYDIRARASLAQRAEDIASIRAILDRHNDIADIHLGGIPMIVADSMDYIRHDLLVFGLAILFFLILILSTAFRRLRWVMLPLVTCAATCLAIIGLLGWLNWRVTVVSSNFVSLLLILSLALTLHIIVRYREIHERNPGADQFTLVSKTVRRIVQPCFFTALTTIVAFGSLLVSGIRPVIDFGWMMSLGIVVAFILSFTLFPAALMLLEPGRAKSRDDLTARITNLFARLIHRYGGQTLSLFTVLALLGLVGIKQLTVENRFIDYYKESTEIYRGMELIDLELGGTTPLDVIIDAPPAPVAAGGGNELDIEFEDIYADETAAEAGITSRSYWFNNRQLDQVEAIHDYFDALPDTGKVISLATFARVVEQLDPDLLQDNFELSVMYEKLPDDIRETMISPYLSDDGSQLRLGIRIFESDATLRRSEFLETIRTDLEDHFDLDESRVNLSGMLVLYNNMLQSLFRSQILTLGAVFLAIMAMFLILFRSLKTAVVAVIPNLLSAALVLGLMGWFRIPLDLMTITIAAITVGIGVDDTIHYIHRFRHEFAIDGDYWASVFRCHRSIGRAIYYTSLTIMLGFSILALSRFIPTIYFGLLTSLAMLIALLANMTLLPLLVVKFRVAGEATCEPASTAA
ncbi:MAG: efflux RND transporter permease subunit, partial [Woeseiaceae bacterium]